MKKARKLGLQSLALVLMAFVLVAGVAFGMTGAWFQSAHNAETSITMGHKVQLDIYQNDAKITNGQIALTRTNDATRGDAGTYAMPGDTYALTGGDVTIKTESYTPGGNAKMWVFLKVTDTAGSGFTLNGIATKTLSGEGVTAYTAVETPSGETEYANTVAPGYNVYLVEASDSQRSWKILDSTANIEINQNLTNLVADQELELTIDVKAVQAANVTTVAAAAAILFA